MKNLNINANKIGQIINADEVNIDQRKIVEQPKEEKEKEDSKREKPKVVISSRASREEILKWIENKELRQAIHAMQRYSLSDSFKDQLAVIEREFVSLNQYQETGISTDEYTLHVESLQNRLHYLANENLIN